MTNFLSLADLPDVADWTAEDFERFAHDEDDSDYLPETHEQLPFPDVIESDIEEEVDEMNTAERLECCAYQLGLKDALLLLIEAQKNGDNLEDGIEGIKKLIASQK